MRKALYILGDLDDRDIIFLSRAGSVRQLAANAPLITAGEAVQDLFFITDGTFDVLSRSGDRLAELGQGDVTGEMSFIEKRTPDANVVARAPGGRVLAVPRAAMLEAFERDTAMAARFYRALAVFLSDRLRSMSGGRGADIDEGLLDNMQQAGERFVRLVRMLEGHHA
jgi:CRP-like cAMP-binding protein